MISSERLKERLTPSRPYRQFDHWRSEVVLSDLKGRFKPSFLNDLDKVMLAYSSFVAGIALVSLTPHTSTNLQVVFGSLAFWAGAVCYLYKRSKIASSRKD